MIDLRCGDCLELMKDIPDKSIDMILCDLPYGTTKCNWDIVIPFEPLWEQYDRIIKDNGAIVLFGSEPFSSKLRLSNINHFKYDWIWQKTKPSGHLNAKKQPLRKYEIISVFYKKQCTYNPQGLILGKFNNNRPSRKSKIQGKYVFGKEKDFGISDAKNYPNNILNYSNSNNKNIHPTQKPVALVEYLIKTYTNEGETVLDNCAGSMSTVIASTNTNRNCIAIEKDKNYFEIGKKRVIEHLKTNNISANLVIFDNECAI